MKEFVIPPEAGARDIINAINAWAAAKRKQWQEFPYGAYGPEECRRLWDYLCALRGPDHPEEQYIKPLTTQRIRTPLLSLCQGFSDVESDQMEPQTALEAGWRPSHFQEHVRYAVRAMRDMGMI